MLQLGGDEQHNIILIGAGGHARACVDVIESEGSFSICGFVGELGERLSSSLGYPVVGYDSQLDDIKTRYNVSNALVAVGQIKTPNLRMSLYEKLVLSGFEMPAICSPYAYVSRHATLGSGSIVMHGAVVNAGASIGCNCIVNSMALIEHDAMIGDHCHVSTGARVNGGVSIGYGTFIGSGAVIRQGVSIGDCCVIGMGQIVINNCKSGIQVTKSWLKK